MKLADFFAAVGPYLEGRADLASARRALWGPEGGPSPDADRLGIYGRFCRVHRFEALESVFARTRAEVTARAGWPAWESLVDEYFRARPMHHPELNENGDGFAEFLAGAAAGAGLPSWIPELADLEWWEWRTWSAPDDPAEDVSDDPAEDVSDDPAEDVSDDPAQDLRDVAPGVPTDDSPDGLSDDRDCRSDKSSTVPRAGERQLRIASTVEVRSYAHDLAGWLDADVDDAADGPAARSTWVLLWRDRDLEQRRAEASVIELLALKVVAEGRLDAPEGVGAGLWRSTLDDLRAAGIVLGALGDRGPR